MHSYASVLYYLITMDDLSFIVSSHIPEARHRVAKHLIGYATIQYMDRGSVVAKYDDRTYEMSGEWFWPAFPGAYTVFHRAPECDSWSHRHLAFQGPLLGRWMATGLWLVEPQPAPEGTDWAEYFDELRRLAETPTRWGRLRAVNMLEALLLRLAESRDVHADQEPWLLRVIQKLESMEDNIEDLALSEGVAESTLRRRFRPATGTPIHKHKVLARIAKARSMLTESDLPLKAIADALGYQNVHFFNRQFKQFVGVPPARYRSTR